MPGASLEGVSGSSGDELLQDHPGEGRSLKELGTGGEKN